MSEKIQISKINLNNGQLEGVPKNPRFIRDGKFELLKKSIEEDPEMIELRELIVVPLDDKYVCIAGNMRLRALRELGYKEAPCKVIDYDDKKLRAIATKDNMPYGDWDWDLIANEWDTEELEEWGFEFPEDVEEEEIHLEAGEDDYQEPDNMQVDVELGDLIEIGEHRLLCGDSTDSDQVARLMNGEKADLLLTDPPYGIGIDGQKKSIASNPKHNRKHHEFRGWDSQRPEQATFEIIISFAEKAIIWGGNYFADLLPAKRGWIYWSKGQNGLTMSDGELAWTTEDKALRAIEVNRGALRGSVHPTQKPIEVMTFCIDWAVNANLILDTFLGSGSTMVAAHQLKRKCYGMELDPKYCKVIIDRMKKLDPSIEVKINGQAYEPKEQTE